MEQVLNVHSVTFSVDHIARTITGLVLPWNEVSRIKYGQASYRFDRGSAKAVDAKFVSFREDHSPATDLGRAIHMQEMDDGLWMTFQLYPGYQGDRVLAQAKSGQKVGLSLGADIHKEDIEPDPDNPGAYLVHLANLLEVSLVGEPAFADSRVMAVTMSGADIGEKMETNDTPAVEETTASTELEEPKSVQFSIPEGYQLVPVPDPKSVKETPTTIVPRVTNAVVTEPVNYTFDASGNLLPARYDFGMDFIQAMNTERFSPEENHLARQRVSEFINVNFDVVRTNVDELSPNINYPRYVDQKDYRSPVFDAVNKGPVPNATQPFIWPAKSSSGSLVAAGTEGAEPSSGTYVTTSQTVVPTTLRGKAKISREVWDIGGVPGIGNIIWTQMQRDYQEALEAKVIAELDAATPTSLATFTVGGGTNKATLVTELTGALAALNYARGGFTMRFLFAQIDLYQALAIASDTTGRRIYPALGPTNADGTSANYWNALNVNGVLVIPTWALAATGSVAASSYLIDPMNVDAWANAPRQLLFDNHEVSNVYLGVWGYAATAINDITGVREVIYDPA